MQTTVALFGIVLVAACGKSTATHDDCLEAGLHFEHAVVNQSAPSVHMRVAGRCVEDAWSVEAAACVGNVRSLDELAACSGELGDGAVALTLAVTSELKRLAEEAAEQRRRDGLEVRRSGDPADAVASLVVEITAAEIVVGGKAFAEADLDSLFRAVVARDRQTQVVIKAHRGVPHGRVVAVMERAKTAGLTHLAIGTID